MLLLARIAAPVCDFLIQTLSVLRGGELCIVVDGKHEGSVRVDGLLLLVVELADVDVTQAVLGRRPDVWVEVKARA